MNRKISRLTVLVTIAVLGVLALGMVVFGDMPLRPFQAVDIWMVGPEGELCGYSEHEFTLNWFEDYMVDETITITIPKGAAFMVESPDDIAFTTNNIVKDVYDISFKQEGNEQKMTFKVAEPIPGSTCSVTFTLRTPLTSKEMKVSAKVGDESVPVNTLANFTTQKYIVKQGLTIDTTADIILKDMEFDVFGLAALNCLPPEDHYRLSMLIYDSNDETKLVNELSWVIDSVVDTDFGYIAGRDYRFTNALFPNTYLDGYYTIRVSLSTEKGDRQWNLIDYVEKEVLFRKNPPQAPKITRTPGGESISAGQNVTINAFYADPEGVPITYEWIGRTQETAKYPVGRNVVQVKAIDAFGLESPWTADLFFVTNADGSGGMTLTGPSSTIIEEGLEGYTISSYTFTVPPVSGHSGNDHGRVRGLNQAGQWVQVNYGTTKNGITLSGTLPAGVYTKLEFYYYTNHTCMYNKSNITYSVKFDYVDGGTVPGVGGNPVNSINITNAISSLDEYASYQLVTEVLPSDATDKSLSWTSSDPAVASIDADGNILALKAGVTTITAISNSTPSITKSFRLDVYPPANIVRVTDIEVLYGNDIITEDMVVRMLPDEEEQLNASVLPINAYDQELIFTSDAPNVVDPNYNGFVGYIAALSTGRAKITVESEQGSGPSLTFYIDVLIPVDSFRLEENNVTLSEGDEYILTATFNPANATDKSIIWSSDDTDIVTVDDDGKLTAIAEGTAIIRAVSNDNPLLEDTCTVIVEAVEVVEANEIIVSPTFLILEEGESESLIVTVLPENAIDKEVIFESDGTAVVEVDADGLVTAKGVGDVSIKVSLASNEDIVEYVTVEVRAAE